MRLSIWLLLAALAGVLGGGALIGLPALGGALIFDSLAVGVWALLRDDGKAAPPARELPSLAQVPTVEYLFERARSAP